MPMTAGDQSYLILSLSAGCVRIVAFGWRLRKRFILMRRAFVDFLAAHLERSPDRIVRRRKPPLRIGSRAFDYLPD
jgi:hypothetical protein